MLLFLLTQVEKAVRRRHPEETILPLLRLLFPLLRLVHLLPLLLRLLPRHQAAIAVQQRLLLPQLSEQVRMESRGLGECDVRWSGAKM